VFRHVGFFMFAMTRLNALPYITPVMPARDGISMDHPGMHEDSTGLLVKP
jgi:hypothetical protein